MDKFDGVQADNGDLPRTFGPITKASPCAACGAELSLSQCNRCGLCGEVVCAGCSPSRLQLQGCAELRRACITCVASAALLDKQDGLRRRMGQLAEQMLLLSSSKLPADTRSGGLAENVAACSAAADALGHRLSEAADLKEATLQRTKKVEVQANSEERSRADIAAAHKAVEAAFRESEEDAKRHLKEMADAIARICDRLHRLASDGQGQPEPTAPPASVAEAADLCEAALRPVEKLCARAEANSKAATDSLMYHAAEAALAPPPVAPRPVADPYAAPSAFDEDEGGRCRVAEQCRLM